MASGAQVKANRENAMMWSTGTRSDEDKRSSSANSALHGGCATRQVAIPRGQFAEDPDEIRSFVAGIVRSLDPRDGLEAEEAQNIALGYLRLKRIGRLEAESIAGAAPSWIHLADLAVDPIVGDSPEARRETSALEVLERILSISSRIESLSSASLDRSLARYRSLRERDGFDDE